MPRPQVPAEDQAGPAGAGVGLAASRPARRGHLVLGDVEAALHLRLGAGEGGEQPVAQHAELQVVEERVHLVAVPRLDGEVGRTQVERDGAVELGEPPVLHHRRQVLAQLLADLALDRVDLVDQRVEGAVLADPLAAVFSPRSGCWAGCRSGRRAARRSRGTARAEAVLGLDLLRREAGHVRHALARVEHGDVVVDQLQGVAVAGAISTSMPCSTAWTVSVAMTSSAS